MTAPDVPAPDPWLQAFLAPGTATCPACGSPLATPGPCTRCHRRFVVGLVATGKWRLAWSLALVGLFLMTGIGTLLALVLAIRFDHLKRHFPSFILPSVILTALGIAALIAALFLIRHRRAICAWSTPQRLLLTAIVYAVLLAEAVTLSTMPN